MVKYSEIISDTMDNGFNVKDEYKNSSIEELQGLCEKESRSFSVCILNLTGDLNVGMMMRSASLFGAKEFVIYGRRKYDKRSTVGAQNYIKNERVEGLTEDGKHFDIPSFIDLVERKNWFPIFVEHDGMDLAVVDWKAELKIWKFKHPCFIFGNETVGIPENLITYFHGFDSLNVSIPQMGVLRSFNVSASMNIVIWDYLKAVYL